MWKYVQVKFLRMFVRMRSINFYGTRNVYLDTFWGGPSHPVRENLLLVQTSRNLIEQDIALLQRSHYSRDVSSKRNCLNLIEDVTRNVVVFEVCGSTLIEVPLFFLAYGPFTSVYVDVSCEKTSGSGDYVPRAAPIFRNVKAFGFSTFMHIIYTM